MNAGTVGGHEETSVASLRVLLVDDDSALLRMLRMTMIANGMTVHTAVHGMDALDRVAEAAPDVIVLDLQMPVMDGRACFRELRRRGIRTPVVILSAFGARRAQMELGAEASLDKPFDPDALVASIRSVA
ncbi:MAG: response regulator [Chloroflexi bacterium]|nr:response regulator [Chloroflexota bacterium]